MAKCFINWTYLSSAIRAGNVFYVQDTTDGIFSNLAAFGASVNAVVLSALKPATYPQVTYVSTDVEDVRTVPFGGITVPISGGTGSRTGTGLALPSGTCIAVKKSTGTLGRSGRGRWYFPMTDVDGTTTGDVITSTSISTILTAMDDFQAGIEAIASGLKMGIVSYVTGGVPRSAGVFEQIVDWSFVDHAVDSQRRRLLGRGG